MYNHMSGLPSAELTREALAMIYGIVGKEGVGKFQVVEVEKWHFITTQ